MSSLFSTPPKSLFDSTPVESEANESEVAVIDAPEVNEQKESTETVAQVSAQEVVQEQEANTVTAREKYKSAYWGVSWSKNAKKWQVIVNIGQDPITKKCKFKSVGLYESETKAAIAYNTFVTENNLDKKLNEVVEN